MAYKSLLLDVNGVVLRDPDLFHHVKEKHIAYVRSKVPIAKDARESERLVRLAYGHTKRGLECVYGVDTSDFVEKVYDKHLMDRLTETLYSTEFQRDAQIIYDLAKGHDWKVTLVSNAPDVWVSKIAEAIGDNVYTCCAKDEARWPEHHIHIFVDDSIKNICAKQNAPNWSPILFTDTKRPGVWYKQIRSFEELALYIHSLDMWIDHDHWHKFEF
jgi:hypothetical protein